MSTTPSKPEAGSKSPVNTPEQNATLLGGIPPKKSIEEINNANDPSKRGPAPDVSRGT